MDMKRKNVDLQQRLDIFHYKMGEDAEMVSSTHSNSSAGTRSIHEPVFPADRITPEREFFETLHDSILNHSKYLFNYSILVTFQFRSTLKQRNDNIQHLFVGDASHQTQSLTRRDFRRQGQNRLQRKPGLHGRKHGRGELRIVRVVQRKQPMISDFYSYNGRQIFNSIFSCTSIAFRSD